MSVPVESGKETESIVCDDAKELKIGLEKLEVYYCAIL
jgi:hypothetical protein